VHLLRVLAIGVTATGLLEPIKSMLRARGLPVA
jgi:hypothetical protein